MLKNITKRISVIAFITILFAGGLGIVPTLLKTGNTFRNTALHEQLEMSQASLIDAPEQERAILKDDLGVLADEIGGLHWLRHRNSVRILQLMLWYLRDGKIYKSDIEEWEYVFNNRDSLTQETVNAYLGHRGHPR